MRQLQLSLAVGTRLLARHFAPLAPETRAALSAPAFGRIRSVAGSEPASRTVVARIAGTALPLPATSVAMRIVGRAQGPLTRRVAAQGFARSATHELGRQAEPRAGRVPRAARLRSRDGRRDHPEPAERLGRDARVPRR